MNNKTKTTLAISFLLVFSSFQNVSPEQMWLDEAISKNIISATFDCNEKSVHYEKPLRATFVNKTNTEVLIKIPTGMVFTADDDEEQNIVVTRNRMAKLMPKGKIQLNISGNCMEVNDNAGSSGSTYSLKGKANSSLYKIVQYINKNKVNPSLGQKAVWCITDKEGLENIYDKNKTSAEALRKYVAQVTGRPLPKIGSFDSYKYNYDAEPLIAVKGAMNLHFNYPCKLQIAMFNEQGTMVRELFRYEELSAGPHRLTYQFDNSVYTDKKYTIRVIQNSEIIYSRTVDLS